jgi:flagellar secretion chaperone FliS
VAHPYAKNAENYLRQSVETASQEQLLLMLYDGAIRFLNLAKKGIETKDIEKSHKNLLNAQHIISHFMDTLDLDIGGDVARNLMTLYEYLHWRLVQANIKKDIGMINEVLSHLTQLKGTWEQAIIISKTEHKQEQALKNTMKDDESRTLLA